MKTQFKFLAILMPFAVASFAGADETFHTLQANGNTYTNVTVTVVTATDIYFSYDGGMGNAKIKNLSPELQKHFDYNATKAAAQEKEQALENAQYQVHVSQAPVKQANAALASRYNVDGYPTCILLDSSGKELGRQVGYAPGGPDAFIAKLDGFSGK
jgi:hypothetical protein